MKNRLNLTSLPAERVTHDRVLPGLYSVWAQVSHRLDMLDSQFCAVMAWVAGRSPKTLAVVPVYCERNR